MTRPDPDHRLPPRPAAAPEPQPERQADPQPGLQPGPQPDPRAEPSPERRTDRRTGPAAPRAPSAPERGARAAGRAAGRLAAGGGRWLLYTLGALSLGAGALAIALPLVGTFAAVIGVGAALVFTGGAGIFAAFEQQGGAERLGAALLALLALAAGVLMLAQPVLGIFALTTVFIAWLMASGVLRLGAAATRRGRGAAGWLLLSGLLALGLGLYLWFGLPENAAWIPGLAFGIDLMFWGALLLAVASGSGGAAAPAEEPR